MNDLETRPSLVTEQHAHAASVLWLRRDLAVAAPHYKLVDLARLDGQLEAQLDGLRVAGDAGWQVCLDELRWREPGELFTAAVLALQHDDPRRVDQLLETVGDAPDLLRAFASACGWLPLQRIEPWIPRLWGSADPRRRWLALAASAVHRRHGGSMLGDALTDDHPPLRARALRAVGEVARQDLLAEVVDAMRGGDPRYRVAAACTVARLTDDPDAVQVLCEWVENHPDGSRLPDAPEPALQLAARRLPPARAIEWIHRLAANPNTLRAAVVASGQTGLAELVPWLLQVMRTPAHARVAGEAFSLISGADLPDLDLEMDPPIGFGAGPTDDPDDEHVDLDPDENLPWPASSAVADWWLRNSGRFLAGERYLLGQPIDEAWMHHVLRDGLQRQRIGAAWELAIRSPQTILFNVEAPGMRQQFELGLREQPS